MRAQQIFDDFKRQTGDVASAAMLTLAAALLGDDQAKLLTVREAADRLNVSPDSVYSACRDWRLKHRKIGRKILIDPADLSKF
jgi:excisionase family DNA binding protein